MLVVRLPQSIGHVLLVEMEKNYDKDKGTGKITYNMG